MYFKYLFLNYLKIKPNTKLSLVVCRTNLMTLNPRQLKSQPITSKHWAPPPKAVSRVAEENKAGWIQTKGKTHTHTVTTAVFAQYTLFMGCFHCTLYWVTKQLKQPHKCYQEGEHSAYSHSLHICSSLFVGRFLQNMCWSYLLIVYNK